MTDQTEAVPPQTPDVLTVHTAKHYRPGSASSGSSSNELVHYGITCDLSRQNPIIGTRYHLRGHNYDLCEAEFLKLPIEDQAKYEQIVTPRPAAERAADRSAFVPGSFGRCSRDSGPGSLWPTRGKAALENPHTSGEELPVIAKAPSR